MVTHIAWSSEPQGALNSAFASKAATDLPAATVTTAAGPALGSRQEADDLLKGVGVRSTTLNRTQDFHSATARAESSTTRRKLAR